MAGKIKQAEVRGIKNPIFALGLFYSVFSWLFLATAIQAVSLDDRNVFMTACPIGVTFFLLSGLLILLDHIFNSAN